jgi:hypothetical protein
LETLRCLQRRPLVQIQDKLLAAGFSAAPRNLRSAGWLFSKHATQLICHGINPRVTQHQRRYLLEFRAFCCHVQSL